MGHSFAFWFWVVGDHPSALMSHQSVTSVKAVVARGAVAACNGAATRSGRPRHTDTPRTMGGYRARSGIAPQTTRRTDGGEAESHTHRSSTDTLHVSARSMWPALSPRSYLAFHRSSCRSPRSQSTWRDDRPVDELTECERLGARWVEHHDSHLILGEELAQGPAVGVAVLIELHPLHGFVVKRKRPGVGAWVTC